MTYVKAKVRVSGRKKEIEDVVLVDTGASLTLLDKDSAHEVDVEFIGRKVSVTVADGHELPAELAVVKKLTVNGEELPYAYVATLKFPEKLKEKLSELKVSSWCILGLTTLELLQLIPDPTTGKLRKTSALFL